MLGLEVSSQESGVSSQESVVSSQESGELKMNNNQLNGLFTDFRQFNPDFCCFEPSNSWGFGVLVEISLITDN
ncbi:hypothetical protein OA58_03970 [Microcystis aeruginosa NIES-88]|nr:hypothetical protein OA58_03970 [Microcystis aeruginosa NIES-88]TRT70768.1 MAG: hypothetical protein EWV68_05985 [Microcystis sp. M_QC_C_20170808_M9Col]